jgi:hypothetical protein
MGKMMPPNTRIDWVPLAGLTTPGTPKVSDITTNGTNLSAAIETGYKLGATDSDVDNSKTIADEGNSETPTLGNYEAMLTFFKDELGTGTNAAPVPATIFTTAFNLFKTAYVEGWLVKRYGKKQNVALAVGDILSVFRVSSDHVREREGDKGNPVRFEVEFAQGGEMYLNRTAVA